MAQISLYNFCEENGKTMKESIQEKSNNLVLFPASKNYPLESSGAFDHADPLEDLLNEFNDAHDCCDESEIELEMKAIESEQKELEQPKLGQLDRMVKMTEQLKKLQDTTNRMSYLMDEIENFLPKRKRR